MTRALAFLAMIPIALASGCLGADDDAGAVDAPGNETTAPPASDMGAMEPVVLTVRTTGVYPVNPGFDPAALEAFAGAPVTLTLTNAESNPLVGHDWVLEGVDGAGTEAAGAGESVTVEFTAPSEGEYAFYCSIGDHRARGMAGVLRVVAHAM